MTLHSLPPWQRRLCFRLRWFVCLSVSGQHYSKSYERIGIKFYGAVLGSTMKNWLNFSCDLGTVNPLYLASIIFSVFTPKVYSHPFNLGIGRCYNVARYKQISVESDDRLGFTYESSTPISYKFVHGHRSYFRKANDTDDYPTIGKTYEFDRLEQFRMFSIAVEIDPSKFLHRLSYVN